jgi:tryptophan halogenase
MKSINSDYKFVIVGGGTAGWLTALYVKRYYPASPVTVIASSEIGILGAGEGTTPHFITFLKEVNVDLSGILSASKGTLKSGIKFTNWNGDGSHYYHPFSQQEHDHTQLGNFWSTTSLFDLEQLSNGRNLNDLILTSHATDQLLSPFRLDNSMPQGIKAVTDVALHFDANLLAEHLKSIAENRGVTHIDDKVVDFIHNDDNDISQISLEHAGVIDCDFVFDCSGFHRLIIGKHYNSKWTSYKDSLPVDKAIPFFIPNDIDAIPPVTESIAMKNGWMWKIPVQGRYGCGYVFDSDFITPDQAKQELDELMGYEVESPRTFSFDPGSYDTTWINNCVAIGLSSGFVEPLEATSIWVTINSLRYWLQSISVITDNNRLARTRYNDKIKGINDAVLEFIHFHYLTKRNDSEFWKTFKTRNISSTNIEGLLSEVTHSIPGSEYFRDFHDYFPAQAWHYVSCGIGLYDPSIAKTMFESYTQGYRLSLFKQHKQQFIQKMKLDLNTLVKHADILKKFS